MLLILSTVLSVINYVVSIDSTQSQLKNQSLPLSIDNIYTDIQKHIIEPYLVSSMMANDTFLKDWLQHKEEDSIKIINYLDTIKNKYKMLSTFLISEKTKKYYTSSSMLEILDESKKENQWYFKFKDTAYEHEINLDYNTNIDNSLIMFINYKIFDKNFHLLGVTGIGLKISYINDMLKMFRQRYNLNVYFFNSNGEMVLTETKNLPTITIDEMDGLRQNRDKIIFKEPIMLEYTKNNEEYILTTKYIKELDLYLVVEAKLDDFMGNVRETFYFNLIVSLIITAFVAYIILLSFRKYQKQLEILAQNDVLTDLLNRRSFSRELNIHLKLYHRNKSPISVLYIDIDDFKNINDTLGHHVGDMVLKRFSKLLVENSRETDLISRWGGEEFLIAFIDTNLEDANVISNKLCNLVANDLELQRIVSSKVTASFGLVTFSINDTDETFISRADKAMYEAKNSGKNKVVKL